MTLCHPLWSFFWSPFLTLQSYLVLELPNAQHRSDNERRHHLVTNAIKYCANTTLYIVHYTCLSADPSSYTHQIFPLYSDSSLPTMTVTSRAASHVLQLQQWSPRAPCHYYSRGLQQNNTVHCSSVGSPQQESNAVLMHCLTLDMKGALL